MRQIRSAPLWRQRSGAVAAQRLRLLLAADESGFPPETLAMLRDDICRVVLRYLDADASQMEVCIRRPESRCAGAENSAGDLPVLCTVIPVRSFRLKGIC